MTEKETHIYCATTPLYFTPTNHDAIIQTLDRHLGYDENFYPIFFPHDVYEAALDTVNDAKIIFSSGVHPDYDLYEINPEQAVRDAGGRFAGDLTNAHIDMIGHPTAYATLALNPDPDIEQLITEGKLSVSPSLGLTRDEAGNIIKIKFQNLLIFPETVNGPAVPGDPGTKILNTKPNPNREDAPINPTQLGKTMTEPIEKPVIDPAVTAQLQELAQQFSLFKKDIESAKSETDGLKAQLAAKDEELKAEKEAFAQFTVKLEEDKAKAKEAEFQGLIHDPLFPEGLLKGDNAEELLRTEFNVSPAQFTRRILTVYATQNKLLGDKGQEQGQQFSQHKPESRWDSDEGKMIISKLGIKRERMVSQ